MLHCLVLVVAIWIGAASSEVVPLGTIGDRTQGRDGLEHAHNVLEELSDSPYPEVAVGDFGTARGTIMNSLLGRPFYAFMSLPYALPPEGPLRFKNPEEWSGKWEATLDGRYDATYLRARCPQVSLILDVIAGREDCLHLSVYTPVLNDSGDPLPVMVWIHGGGYLIGDAHLYVPTKLMDRDVVVVVVQYRLGTLGFLAGATPEAPGNMGLMDQIMALRWVQNYIHLFGGDRDSVTVFGQSAGGASSSWMQVSPLTNETNPNNKNRQLLHSVAPMSGSALEHWTLDPDPESGFILTAQVLECDSAGDKEQMVACMREKSFEEVVRASIKIFSDDMKAGGLGFKALCPVVQEELAATGHPDLEVVIPKNPVKIIEENEFLHIPVMTGSVRDEGSLVVGLAYENFLMPNDIYTNDTEFLRFEMLPTLLNGFGIDDRTGGVSNAMRKSFLPNSEMGDWDSMVGGLVDLGGMLFLKSGLWEISHLMNRVDPSVPIFFYSWEFEQDDSVFPWIFMSSPDIPVPGGIGHGDELINFFHLPGVFDESQQVVLRRMLTLWTNFAKYGDPTPDEVEHESEEWKGDVPKWNPFDVTDLNFMLMKHNFTNERDFSTRWNYNIDGGITTTQGPTTTEGPAPVSRDDYDEQVRMTEQFQLATGILGGVCACCVFLVVFLFVKMRRYKTV